ncbi:MAG: hypothetical protein J7513_12775 [Solirubrobacteraceae bacterium]|nr:hypothetical protein [Solirubrobacteraceae bacterium]
MLLAALLTTIWVGLALVVIRAARRSSALARHMRELELTECHGNASACAHARNSGAAAALRSRRAPRTVARSRRPAATGHAASSPRR